jgi:hypothetical protein
MEKKSEEIGKSQDRKSDLKFGASSINIADTANVPLHLLHPHTQLLHFTLELLISKGCRTALLTCMLRVDAI